MMVKLAEFNPEGSAFAGLFHAAHSWHTAIPQNLDGEALVSIVSPVEGNDRIEIKELPG